MKKSIRFTVASLLCMLLLTSSFGILNTHKHQVKTVVIDAGHGGKDPGCSGHFSKEKDVALKIALEVGKIINEYAPDVKVIYTRKDNRFIELDDRARIANKNNADLFISIHCNALSRKEVHGTESYVMGLHTSEENLSVAMRENSVILKEDNYEEDYGGFDPNSPLAYIMMANMQSAYQEQSILIANNVESQFKNRVQRHSRGVKQAGFLVLRKTAMPSVLIETGYLTNASEEKYLNSDLGRLYIASGIYRAFRDYKQAIEKQ